VQRQRARAALAARSSAGSRKARTKWSIPLRGAAETRVEVAETGATGDADLGVGDVDDDVEHGFTTPERRTEYDDDLGSSRSWFFSVEDVGEEEKKGKEAAAERGIGKAARVRFAGSG
jgi:hypothetical protein